MLDTNKAYKQALGVRGVIIALIGLVIWIVVAGLTSAIVQMWVSHRVALVAGHVVGATVFGLLMQRLVYARGKSRERAI